MTVQITDVRMSGSGRGHESISDYLWIDSANSTTNWASKAAMVDWVRQNPNKAWVHGSAGSAWVIAVDSSTSEPYLRTMADGVLSDNLLSLPGAR